MKQNGKILVPLDGSKVAESILPYVEEQAKAFNATISILRSYYGHDEKAQVDATQEAENYVHRIEQMLKAKGFNVDSRTQFENDASQAILEHSKKVDIVMMSTHGHGALKHILLGSVAEKVVHHSTVPVYLVRSVLK